MTHNPDPLEELLRSAGPARDRARRSRAAGRSGCAARMAGRRAEADRAAGAPRWIAASCLTSAALIALVLHAHVGQVAPQADGRTVAGPRPLVRPMRRCATRDTGSYFRANNEDRPPDRGVPRHVLASYSWETR